MRAKELRELPKGTVIYYARDGTVEQRVAIHFENAYAFTDLAGKTVAWPIQQYCTRTLPEAIVMARSQIAKLRATLDAREARLNVLQQKGF